ncbi:hypothetical protein ACTFIR_005758 [Dictyostelium discoideum]
MEQSKINEIISYVMGNKKTIRLNNQYKNYIVKSKSNGVNELLYGKEFKIPKDDGIFDKHLVYLKDFHAAHLGRDKTYQMFLDAGYYYSGLFTQVEIDCNTCDYCQRINIKGSKKEHKPIQDNSPYNRICYDLTSMNLEHRESVSTNSKIVTKIPHSNENDTFKATLNLH